MDPLSFAASIIAVAALATKVTTSLLKLRDISNFPGRLYAIHNEVADLEVLLHHASSVVQSRKTLLPSQVPGELTVAVEQANTKLQQLQTIIDDLIARCVGDGKFITRTKAWLTKRQQLEDLRDSLRVIKANLNVTLGATHS